MTEDKNKYILSINGMSKSFGRNKVLKHISMNVKPGTIMGLMGENGIANATHNVAANNLFLKARLISSLNILFITTAPV